MWAVGCRTVTLCDVTVTRIYNLSLAYYDFEAEPWRAHSVSDRPGVCVRVDYYPPGWFKEYYPSAGVVRLIQCLAFTHEFSWFEFRGTNRIKIRRRE